MGWGEEAQGWFSWEKNAPCSQKWRHSSHSPSWFHTPLPFPGKPPVLLELLCVPHISGICYHFGPRLSINQFASHLCQVETLSWAWTFHGNPGRKSVSLSPSDSGLNPSPTGPNHTRIHRIPLGAACGVWKATLPASRGQRYSAYQPMWIFSPHRGPRAAYDGYKKASQQKQSL